MRLSLCLLLCIVFEVQEAKEIDTIVTKYFNSPSYKSFSEQWKKFRKPIEHSLESILRETYGEEGMNVYVRRWSNPYKLSDGVLVSDNIVQVLLKDLYLTQMPHLINPEVSFALASNVLVVEAKVNRMFIQADYQLFRNLSTVTYSSAKLDPFKISPFNLQQVKSDGEVTIVADGCTLRGIIVASLHDRTVNLGQDTIRLTNCMFSVEISTPGLGSPPVIAPYFSKEQGAELELLLTNPIRDELLPKLQGAVYSYVNTSALFGTSLPKIRQQQQDVFKHTWRFMSLVTKNVNKMTMDQDRGIEKLKDIVIQWSDKDEEELNDYKVVVKDVTITGFDSAYSAQNGGPYKMPDMTISDSIRFSGLQIRGNLYFTVGTSERNYVFYGEINDISSYISLGVHSKASIVLDRCEVTGWRNFDLHTPNIPQISTNQLITGIILNKLPNVIIGRLTRSFTKAVEGADKNVGSKDDNSPILNESPVVQEEGANEVPEIKNEQGTDNDYEKNGDVEENEMNVLIEHDADDQTDFNNDDENKTDGVQNEANVNNDENNAVNDSKKAVNNKQEQKHANNMFGKVLQGNKMFDENMFGGDNIFKDAEFGGDGDNAAARAKRGEKGTETADQDSPQNLEEVPPFYMNYHNCPKNTLKDSPPKIEFRLFTRDNKNHYILLDENAEPVDIGKRIDLANAPLKVITHGWISSADDASVALIKDAYLNTNYLNIVAVDWSTLADTSYCIAALWNVDIVGKTISRFLKAVNMRYRLTGDDMHLIGHSLGAHVVGISAWKTPFAISRVTGLDPAGPLFYLKFPTERIDASCADFVDIIHTNGGLMGFAFPIGHKDFFPNSGMFIQPGCADSPNPVSCSHARSYYYYVESIYVSDMYPSLRCDTWKDFLIHKCNYYMSFMGDRAVPLFGGKYYLNTLYEPLASLK